MRLTDRPGPSYCPFMHAVIWGAPDLTPQLIDAGIVVADQHGARAGLVRIEGPRDLEALRRLREARPELPVVVVIARGSDEATLALRAVELGALGVLGGDPSVAEIATALESVVAGRPAVAPAGAQLLILALRARCESRVRFNLTGREREVLGELIAGHTTHTIASRLGIGFSTVQTHLKSIYRKLDVGSKAAATATALRHQLV